MLVSTWAVVMVVVVGSGNMGGIYMHPCINSHNSSKFQRLTVIRALIKLTFIEVLQLLMITHTAQQPRARE